MHFWAGTSLSANDAVTDNNFGNISLQFDQNITGHWRNNRGDLQPSNYTFLDSLPSCSKVEVTGCLPVHKCTDSNYGVLCSEEVCAVGAAKNQSSQDCEFCKSGQYNYGGPTCEECSNRMRCDTEGRLGHFLFAKAGYWQGPPYYENQIKGKGDVMAHNQEPELV